MHSTTQGQRLGAELLGTAFLLATVIGSGIMGERLAGGNVAIALLGNTIPTGAMLVVLITMLGPISGAHFNPAVTGVFLLKKEIEAAEAGAYVVAQVLGAVLGVLAAHLMFGEALLQVSAKVRAGPSQWFSEWVAAFGLVVTILLTLRANRAAVPAAVGLYITAAYWFTASTSFANPAVTIARSLSDTFAGIRPADVAPFVIAQLIGAASALYVCRWLGAAKARRAASGVRLSPAGVHRAERMRSVRSDGRLIAPSLVPVYEGLAARLRRLHWPRARRWRAFWRRRSFASSSRASLAARSAASLAPRSFASCSRACWAASSAASLRCAPRPAAPARPRWHARPGSAARAPPARYAARSRARFAHGPAAGAPPPRPARYPHWPSGSLASLAARSAASFAARSWPSCSRTLRAMRSAASRAPRSLASCSLASLTARSAPPRAPAESCCGLAAASAMLADAAVPRSRSVDVGHAQGPSRHQGGRDDDDHHPGRDGQPSQSSAQAG